jgi:hypothetical protein
MLSEIAISSDLSRPMTYKRLQTERPSVKIVDSEGNCPNFQLKFRMDLLFREPNYTSPLLKDNHRANMAQPFAKWTALTSWTRALYDVIRGVSVPIKRWRSDTFQPTGDTNWSLNRYFPVLSSPFFKFLVSHKVFGLQTEDQRSRLNSFTWYRMMPDDHRTVWSCCQSSQLSVCHNDMQSVLLLK